MFTTTEFIYSDCDCEMFLNSVYGAICIFLSILKHVDTFGKLWIIKTIAILKQ